MSSGNGNVYVYGTGRSEAMAYAQPAVGPGTLIGERFEIEERAGSGGMGTVYRAKDTLTGHVVALKVLESATREYDERFMREGRALAELKHPGIVGYEDHGRTAEGVPYIAMEWLDGEDLQARLAKQNLTIAETVAMIGRIAEGLGAAHARGVVHRDVKPSNVFLVGGDPSRAKLLDFGVAHLAGLAGGLTRTGALVGTPSYMSPEQARGDRNIDARADVFSLGCIAYRCLTGKRPFNADDIMAVAVKLLLEEPARVDELRPEVPKPLADLVMSMLTKEREARPRDGAAVARELELIDEAAVAGNVPPAARSAPAPSSLTDSEQRFVSVVVAEPPLVSTEDTTVERTIAEPTARRRTSGRSLAEIATQHGARIERLRGDTVVATLSFRSGGTEEIAKAAHVALALRESMPTARLSLVMGRAIRAGKLPLGDALESAVAIVRESVERGVPAGTIIVDEATAHLLNAQFDVTAEGARFVLLGERSRNTLQPKLLGKRSPCVGRERELGTLSVTLDECLAEPRACAVILTAAPGMGKTRLLNEFVARMKKRDAPVTVWRAEGDAGSPGSPFAIVRRLLRSGLGNDLRDEALRGALEKRVREVARESDAARLIAFLSELLGLPRPESDDDLVPRSSPMLMGDHLQRAFEDFLSAECAREPIALVIDDLQWGDGPSVRLLDGALRHLRDASLLVLAAARAELDTAFPNLWSERAPLRMPLGPLSRKAGEMMVRAALGKDVPAEVVDLLVARADGNALYLEELVRGHVEGRAEVPPTVLLSVQARLDELDGGVRRVLRAASIYGGSFWRGGVLALIGDATNLADDALGHLVDRELISSREISRFSGQDEYAFRHALFREAAYATLTDADRALGHRLAGAWLERNGERDAHVLADHYERGGERASAIRWLLAAAEDALSGSDFTAVLDRVARGIACGATGAEKGRFELLAAEAHRWTGSSNDALRHAEEAFALLERGSDEWQHAGAEVVHAARRLERIDRCLEVVHELERASDVLSSPAAEAMAITATEMMYDGRHEEAGQLVQRMRVMSEGTGDRLVTMHLHHAISEQLAIAGDLSESLRHEKVSLEVSIERGDLRDMAQRRSNVAHGYTELGAYGLAEAELREAEAAAERLGLAHVAALVRLNLGWTFCRRGELREARRLIEGASAEFARMGHTRLEAGALGYLAHVLLRAGDPAGAETMMTRVLTLEAPAAEHLFAYATRALARLARGDTQHALDDASRAASTLEEQGGIAEGEVIVRLAYAEALFAIGRTEEGKAALAKVKQVVLATAGRITDASFRDSYLTRVPENVRVLDLARSWLEETRP